MKCISSRSGRKACMRSFHLTASYDLRALLLFLLFHLFHLFHTALLIKQLHILLNFWLPCHPWLACAKAYCCQGNAIQNKGKVWLSFPSSSNTRHFRACTTLSSTIAHSIRLPIPIFHSGICTLHSSSHLPRANPVTQTASHGQQPRRRHGLAEGLPTAYHSTGYKTMEQNKNLR